ncbi:MAG: glycerophosphodiester phosphodiesterase family protein [Fermentimonas sp.]|nr:glycerophosphodiester phosphodiesterase family protein [Fermentimonas sp.]
MIKLNISTLLYAVILITTLTSCKTEVEETTVKLIAHRGGVVNDSIQENSREAIINAAERGYWAVELDMRMTADSVLIAHHDRNLKRHIFLK